MQDWIGSKSLLFSRIFVVLFALLLLALDIWGYPIVTWFGQLRRLHWQRSLGILIELYACSVLGWILLWNMWRLLGDLQKGLIFTAENIARLGRVSWCCAGAAALCALGCSFYMPFLIPVAAASFMALIVRIVRNVFQKALDMKSELDLTV